MFKVGVVYPDSCASIDATLHLFPLRCLLVYSIARKERSRIGKSYELLIDQSLKNSTSTSTNIYNLGWKFELFLSVSDYSSF